uniref:Homeobox domain-containing protein n=1 Tax=Ditylenchus dipsaci TaxID=166011 RepID=A0A915E540_9BILA
MVNSNFPPNPSFIDFAGYAYGPPPSSSGLNHADQGGKRERTKFNEYQLRQLERVFEKSQYPQGAQREQLAASLTLTETKIQVWFKNRRAKMRANKKFDELRRQTPDMHQRRAAGGTEDENEGAKSVKPDKEETTKTGKNLKNFATSGHFPSAMPMIPLPNVLDFKIEPPPDAGGSIRGSAATEQQQFINSMTSTFNPLNNASVHPGWMPSPYPTMFGNSASYGLGFTNHPSSGPYYHSAASMHACDHLYNPPTMLHLEILVVPDANPCQAESVV